MHLTGGRFTLSGLMGLVALIGVGLGLCAARRCHFLDLAAYHRQRAIEIGRDHAIRNPGYCPFTFLSLRHDRMALNYKLAADKPWLPVQPDPPQRQP